MPSKQELINEIMGIDPTIKGLGSMNKSQLEDLHGSLSQVFETATLTVEEAPEVAVDADESEEPHVPNMYDPEWTDWILSQMADYEKENGNPKVDGLRRVANKYLGQFSSVTDIKQTPDNSNGQRATVVVTLNFVTETHGYEVVSSFSHKSYSGAADVYPGNTNKDFARHAVATAETRAEGRALKRALCLTKVISAEEVYDKNLSELSDGDSKASEAMVNGFKMQAEKQGIDPYRLAVYNEVDIEDIKDLTRGQVQMLSAKVSMYHRGEEQIPDGVKM